MADEEDGWSWALFLVHRRGGRAHPGRIVGAVVCDIPDQFAGSDEAAIRQFLNEERI